jgi:hypothetical protein
LANSLPFSEKLVKPGQLEIKQSTQKIGGMNTRIKMEGSTTSKKTKEPPKRPNHKGNIKFLNPLLSPEAGSELEIGIV